MSFQNQPPRRQLPRDLAGGEQGEVHALDPLDPPGVFAVAVGADDVQPAVGEPGAGAVHQPPLGGQTEDHAVGGSLLGAHAKPPAGPVAAIIASGRTMPPTAGSAPWPSRWVSAS